MRCARCPRSARQGALQELFPILERVCDGQSHVFKLLLELSRWRRLGERRNLFLVNYRQRLRDNLSELTVALAALLYPSEGTYTEERAGDVCVARTGGVELMVTAVDASFNLAVRRVR
jgi:hypothetical protein